MVEVIKITDKIATINSAGSTAVYEFTCTSTDDIAELPISTADIYKHPNVRAGSTCICTADASVWMLGADDVWHKL